MSELSAGGLMVDLLTRSEEGVITNRRPRFSWIVNDVQQGGGQSAYRILVGTEKAILEEEWADTWDSGKVDSVESTAVLFGGKPLEPHRTYWWKVRIWGTDGRAGSCSETRFFRTGDFSRRGEKWPGESRWVEIDGPSGGRLFLEDRRAIDYHEIRPAAVSRNGEGNLIIAFDRAAFGTLLFRLNQPPETARTVTVHLGEKAMAPGDRVDRGPGGSTTYRKATIQLEPGLTEYRLTLPRQVSRYPNSQVLPDHMPEVTAFRFAEIENLPEETPIESVRQLALLYPFDDDASDFSSSDANLNQVWDLCKHTLKVTPFFGLYLDGARERMPYEADAYLQQISHYCVDREYAIARYTGQFLIYNPAWPTEWHLHMVLIAWADYMQTANADFLERNYEELKKKTLIALSRDDGLISTRTGKVTKEFLATIHYHGNGFRDIVDWPQGTPAGEAENRSGHGSERIEGETDRFVFSEINTVVNAFHYRNLVLMARIAAVLGKNEDASYFEQRGAKVKAVFNKVFLNRETGLYTDGEGVGHSSLHANLFPAVFGLAPEASRKAILTFLKSRGMACSPYGAAYLLEAVYSLNDPDYALELLTAEHDRSWMNMIRLGSTITTEAWDRKYKKNMTWNHAWGASPAYTITRKLMGIEPLAPAFRKLRIYPRPGSLTYAAIKTPTIRGTVRLRAEREPSKCLSLRMELPANTEGQLVLDKPGKARYSVTLNGMPADFREYGGRLVIDPLPSGRNNVVLTLNGEAPVG